jgi:hypothetical protein
MDRIRGLGDLIQANQCPLSASEIVHELRHLRFDPENGRGKGRKVPLKRIAEQARLHRATLYRAIIENRLSDKSREALSPVLLFMSQTDV